MRFLRFPVRVTFSTWLNFIPFLAILCCLITVLEASTLDSGPKIQLSEESWYFGFLPTNVKVQHNYWIRSVGTDTLRIIKVLPGCGCTTAPLSKDIIPPGDSAELKLLFNTEKMIGRIMEQVNITCNDPQRPSVPVRFHGIVNYEHDSVQVRPRLIGFSEGGKGNYRAREALEIFNNSKSDIDLQIVDNPADFLEVMLSRKRLAAGSSAKIELRIARPPEKGGDINTSFTIEFSGSQKDRITVPIEATFRK